MIGAYGLVFR